MKAKNRVAEKIRMGAFERIHFVEFGIVEITLWWEVWNSIFLGVGRKTGRVVGGKIHEEIRSKLEGRVF